MVDKPNRKDSEIAKEFWDNFKARNESIIVDLLYGQLKSTVTCLTCKTPNLTFDPQLMLVLPITRQIIFNVLYLPIQRFSSSDTLTEMQSIRVAPKPQWKFADLIQYLNSKCGAPVQLCTVEYGKVTKYWTQ